MCNKDGKQKKPKKIKQKPDADTGKDQRKSPRLQEVNRNSSGSTDSNDPANQLAPDNNRKRGLPDPRSSLPSQ